jgi:hypothetical protein
MTTNDIDVDSYLVVNKLTRNNMGLFYDAHPKRG